MCILQLAFSLLLGASKVDATLTTAEKNGILAKHNELRAAIATPCTASDMETLVWDDDLATASQTYADACVGDHDPRAAIDFGENLWMLTSGSNYNQADIIGAVQEWYDEIKDVEWIKNAAGEYAEAKSKAGTAGCESPDHANGNCFIGHFTQVVWAKSTKVGCGVQKCSPMTVSGSSYSNGALLVCRYTPSGNSAPSQAANHVNMPFVAGAKCAACSGSCSTAGLCDTGSTPTRCSDAPAKDLSLNGQNYPDCTAYVGAVSAMLGQSGMAACNVATVVTMVSPICDLSCNKCSVPSGVGIASCGASGGNTGASNSGASNTGASNTGASNTGASTSTSVPCDYWSGTTSMGRLNCNTSVAVDNNNYGTRCWKTQLADIMVQGCDGSGGSASICAEWNNPTSCCKLPVTDQKIICSDATNGFTTQVMAPDFNNCDTTCAIRGTASAAPGQMLQLLTAMACLCMGSLMPLK
jgi:hypothetical protein